MSLYGCYVTMQLDSSIYWDVTPCGLAQIHENFEDCISYACSLRLAGFQLDLLLSPEDGSRNVLENVCELLQDYKTRHILHALE
jgi:dimeric dUTPase (all-alpha-NTP-PPase superfamily)